MLCGATGSPELMIRFARAPDGGVVPDLAERLPGRGFRIHADRAALEESLARGRFRAAAARSLREQVAAGDIDAGLAARIDTLLRRRVADRIGLERRAGRVVAGFEKVAAKLRKGGVAVLLEARDGARDGLVKLRGLAGSGAAIVSLLDRDQLGLALGRENVVHAAVDAGKGAEALLRDCRRLAAWENGPLAISLDATVVRQDEGQG